MSEMDPKVRKGLDDLLTFVRQEIDEQEVNAFAHQLQNLEWQQVCAAFDEAWGETPRDNCGGWTTSSDPPCGGCYECCLAQTLHGQPSWQSYLDRARRELANEAFGTTCVDCGRAIGDEDETVPDEDGNLLHVGCGDRP